MSRFNTGNARPSGRGAIATVDRPDGRTHEGGAGYSRDKRSELFLAAVSSFSDNTFYESDAAMRTRMRGLVRKVAVEDPRWIRDFLRWLRTDARIRTASLILAAEAVKGRLEANAPDPTDVDSDTPRGINRQIIDVVLQRPDEPGEMLAYWQTTFGKALPKPVKRGIADAVTRLFSERCVTPDTLVLKRDLTWIRAGDLVVGDELVGFDEKIRSTKKRGGAALMGVATVTGMRNAMLETVRVNTSRGRTSVSVDHQFVVINDRKREWRRAGDLKPGDRLSFFGAPWETDSSREAGWMAGFLDGEGSVNNKCVAVSQVTGDTCEYAKEIFKHLGFDFSVQVYQAKGNRQQKETLKILGGRYESMRLLGTIGGVRLNRDRLWVGGDLVSKGRYVEKGSSWAVVESVENLGVQENVTMSTSTKTFISDGFLSHNSLLKYDGQSKGYRFGDVIELTHPSAKAPWQGRLFSYAIDRRHNRENPSLEGLSALQAREVLAGLSPEGRHEFMRRVRDGDSSATEQFRLAMAGQWEWAKSWLGE